MVSLPATSPLRAVNDVESSIDLFSKGGCDVVVTVSEAHRNPYFNMVSENSDGTVGLVMEDSQVSRRQDAPIIRDLTTVCYVASPQFVLSHDSIFEGRVKAVNVPKERAIDIDSLLDFQIAEFLLNSRKEI
jgi:N-acylneuraminate cytidylyltransferase